jgi:hypothetical protein
MKLNKATYFSIFFLLCFTASFSLSNFQNLKTVTTHLKCNHGNSIEVNDANNCDTNASDFLFEENENDGEDFLQIQSFVLPYLIAYTRLQATSTKIIYSNPLSLKVTKPIYISVCNFRI